MRKLDRLHLEQFPINKQFIILELDQDGTGAQMNDGRGTTILLEIKHERKSEQNSDKGRGL